MVIQQHSFALSKHEASLKRMGCKSRWNVGIAAHSSCLRGLRWQHMITKKKASATQMQLDVEPAAPAPGKRFWCAGEGSCARGVKQ